MLFNSKWYNSLAKPLFSPPAFLFRPVWNILYILILFSFLIYIFKNTELSKFKGYLFFTFQMILNGLWVPAFFYFQNIKLAFVIVVLTDIFVILTIKEFYKVSKLASFILIPYLIWILYATYLNFGYMWLNK